MPAPRHVSKIIASSPTWKFERKFIEMIDECEDFFLNAPANLSSLELLNLGLKRTDRIEWFFGGDMEIIPVMANNEYLLKPSKEPKGRKAAAYKERIALCHEFDGLVESKLLGKEWLDDSVPNTNPISWENYPGGDDFVMELRFKPVKAADFVSNKMQVVKALEEACSQLGMGLIIRSDHLHVDFRRNGENLIETRPYNFFTDKGIVNRQLNAVLQLYAQAPLLIVSSMQADANPKQKVISVKDIDIGYDKTSLLKVHHYTVELRRTQSHDYFHPSLAVATFLKACCYGIMHELPRHPACPISNGKGHYEDILDEAKFPGNIANKILGKADFKGIVQAYKARYNALQRG